MTQTVSTRDRIHDQFCRDDQCMLEYDDPGKNCLRLDYLLTLVEIEALDKAEQWMAGSDFPLTDVFRVQVFARRAHAGQVDKLGVPYFGHVQAVAEGLTPFGDDLVMAGYLHDVLEDTAWTADDLAVRGLPSRALNAVLAVTNTPGGSYQEKILSLVGNRDALLVKVADNAHNSRADRLANLDPTTRQRLEKKYAQARRVLWGAVPAADVNRIVSIVNPALLGE